MKLLFDENLSPKLVELLSDVFPDSVHVNNCGLGHSVDEAIWQFAKTNGLTIVTKDSDFQERAVLPGSPPKVIWIRIRNCNSVQVAALLRRALAEIRSFIQKDEETCLILS